MNGKTETLCVFGHPVAHSKSPLMHNALFKALGINAAYLPYGPEPENFAQAIQGFRAMKFRGANITIPYKTPVMELVDELSPISKFTGSVNTLYWKDGNVGGTLCGTTTDPYGCIRNLEENGVKLSGRKIALLGNGGAASAIAFALVNQHNKLTIICRNIEKGGFLADRLNKQFENGINAHLRDQTLPFQQFYPTNAVTFADFVDISKDYEIIINATSVGMTPNEDESPLESDSLNPGQAVCDIVYAPPQTKLLKLAAEKGCKTVTGEGMLVNQGLESFKKWCPEQVKGHSDEELRAIMRKGMEGI